MHFVFCSDMRPKGGSEVLLQGLTLTIVGMSVVFVFLTILVFVMKFISTFVPKFFPDDKPIKQLKSKQHNLVENAEESVSMGEAEIAAVIAAVKSYSQL